MQEGAKEEQIQHVIDRLVSMGFDIQPVNGPLRRQSLAL